MRSKEDVISIIRSYCLANDGDEATTDLLLAVGAEILGVSAEEMQKYSHGLTANRTFQTRKTDMSRTASQSVFLTGRLLWIVRSARLIGRLNTANPSNNARHFTVATAARTVLRTMRMRRKR